jgi:hypothetical protein
MTEIILIRGAGDSQEEVLENPLASDLLSKMALGRNYLDDHALPVTDLKVDVLYRDDLKMGTVVEVENAVTGVQWLAKITGVAHNVNPSDRGRGVSTTLTLSLPEDSL